MRLEQALVKITRRRRWRKPRTAMMMLSSLTSRVGMIALGVVWMFAASVMKIQGKKEKNIESDQLTSRSHD
jgi:hypothetical protein